MNQKGFTKVVLMTLVIVIFIAVAVYFVSTVKKENVAVSPTGQKTEIADWKIYQNEDLGLSFLFPLLLSAQEASQHLIQCPLQIQAQTPGWIFLFRLLQAKH